MTEAQMVRRLWTLIEPIHAVLYYAPEATEEAAAVGYSVDTRWSSYFAWRTAPLGAAGPRLVSATYYSFSPAMVAEHVPAVWEIASPGRVLEARTPGSRPRAACLAWRPGRRPELAEAAALAQRAALAANVGGRPLAAANADLPWPTEPHLILWQAATILREHRGDGHIAALLSAGLDPCEALVSFATIGAAPAKVFASRGWTDDEWQAARNRLMDRDWVDSEGVATECGRAGRDAVERRTDELAAAPWAELGPLAGKFAALTMPIMQTIVRSDLLPRQSTLGIGR